jgi:hypothetical protein
MADVEHRHLAVHWVDRLVAGLVPPDQATALEGQAQACADCRARLDEARRACDLFLTRNPPAERARALLAEVERPVLSGRRRWLFWAPALSAACAILVVVAVTRRPPDQRGAILEKGAGVSLGFSVKPRGALTLRPGTDGELLRSGDAIQLHLQAGPFEQARVLAVDPHGQAKPLFDWQSGAAPPPSLVLDDSPEPEKILVIFHNGDADLAAIERGGDPGPEVAVRSILIRKTQAPSHGSGLGRP